jgi:putative glycosyltransferase (TIGR04372 family)
MNLEERRERLVLDMRRRIFRILELFVLPLSFPLAILLRVALRIVKPWVHIRFVRWSSMSLGIWAIPTEVYLCQRDAGMHPKRSLDLFYRYDRNAYALKRSVVRSSAICNKQLDKMFRAHIRLWEGAQFLDYLNRLLPRGSEAFTFKMPEPYDQEGLLKRFPTHLIFTQEEERKGQSALAQLGVPPGAPFFCFHARDSAYHARWRPGLELFYHGERQWLDERNSSIQNYLPAAEKLTELGYYAIRMGKYVEKPIPSGNPRIIDYAWSHQSDFMDVYLSAHCAFFIGHNSGITALPVIFRRPLVFVNIAPLSEIVYCSCSNSIFIPKKYYAKRFGRHLTFQEIVSNKILSKLFMAKHSHLPEIRDELQLELHENTPEEITELALEMHECLQGTFRASPEDEDLRRRFLAILRLPSLSRARPPLHDLCYLAIGSHFMRRHRELLEQREEACLSA